MRDDPDQTFLLSSLSVRPAESENTTLDLAWYFVVFQDRLGPNADFPYFSRYMHATTT